jgi:hypothetical protein
MGQQSVQQNEYLKREKIIFSSQQFLNREKQQQIQYK